MIPALLLTARRRAFVMLVVMTSVIAHVAVHAQTRGAMLNLAVTPEPTALANVATTAVNVLKISPKVSDGLSDYGFDLKPTRSVRAP